MNKNNTLEKEIEYWTVHQDLDKFNYNFVGSFVFSLIAILIALMALVSDVKTPENDLKWAIIVLVSKIILTLGIVGFIFYLTRIFKKEAGGHNISFMTREEMIKYRYNKLGVNKDELNKEFEDIKKIIEETMKDAECRKARIEKYYSDKEKKKKKRK